MKVFDYSKSLWNGEGEGFFFNEKECALSFFRFPNTNHLRGIGLHVHPQCDDIEVLIKGKILCFNTWTESTLIDEPAVIANLAGTPHSVIADKASEVLLYGIRAPFKGGDKIAKEDHIPDKKPLIFKLSKYGAGSHELYESAHTLAFFHRDISTLPARYQYQGRCIINVSKRCIELNAGSQLLPLSSIYQNNRPGSLEQIILTTASNSFVEIIAKVGADQ